MGDLLSSARRHLTMSDPAAKMSDSMMARSGSEETIGQRLKRLRLELGMSQRELASPGVSYAYISRIEAGTRQPSVKALRRLASKLGVSSEYLETGSDLDAVDARELRLADAELALRLEHSADAESTVREVLEDAVAAGDAVNAARVRSTPTIRTCASAFTGRSRASRTWRASRPRRCTTRGARSPCSRRPTTRSTSRAPTSSAPGS